MSAMDTAPVGEMKTPGEVLGPVTKWAAGPGTHVAGGNVVASLTGRCQVSEAGASGEDKNQLPALAIVHGRRQPAIPRPGAIVTCRVTKVDPRLALADILCVGSRAATQKFSGVVRQEDVRATEIDKVDMFQSFRPGDIIRAAVLSLGDSRAFQLSTARNELGVVYAKSFAGAPMAPVSWQEMECPVTRQREPRKVAKVS